MKLDRYEINASAEFLIFEFISTGPKVDISKIIQFELVGAQELYNLAFGDKRPGSDEIDDLITDNGDSEKILATVVSALYSFSEHYPAAWVYATGSTKSRTRLYRMGINKYIEFVNADFELFGQISGGWELFKEGRDYEAFIVKRKN
ncbi:MAG: hypothetical protein V4722_02265 [Bacteroidota bacterium]